MLLCQLTDPDGVVLDEHPFEDQGSIEDNSAIARSLLWWRWYGRHHQADMTRPCFWHQCRIVITTLPGEQAPAALLVTLRTHGPLTIRELADTLGRSYPSVRSSLYRFRNRGQVARCEDGQPGVRYMAVEGAR